MSIDISKEKVVETIRQLQGNRKDPEYSGFIFDAMKILRAQAARIAELEAASAWRPIETAPKDGTEILIYRQGISYLAVYDEGKWWTPDTFPCPWFELADDPTHWQPPRNIGD